jgi:serine/threonine protein kinase
MPDDLPAFTAPQVGNVIAGKYQVVRHIGDGGMGSVVEAKNVLTGKRVAVKCMLPDIAARADAVQRFIEEARVCTSVQHPNVVDVLDLIRDAASVFIVMELLEGESLRAFMSNGRAAPHEIVALLLEAMHGVRAAHGHGIIHRDIKPENVFLAHQAYGPARRVKVLDFGLSKPVNDRARVALSRVGEPMGTLHYMSREQLNGVHDIDARTDVYAFGVILYEALSGQIPYPAETVAELAVQFDRFEPLPLRRLWPEVPHGLEALVMRAIARERNDRIPSLDVMISALRPFAEPASYRSVRPRPRYDSGVVSRARAAPEPEPRESFPSLDSVAPELTLGPAYAAAIRGELRVWSAVRLLFAARSILQVLFSIVLTAFVAVWNTAQLAVSILVFAIDLAFSVGAPRRWHPTRSILASRHAKQLLALMLMCVAIYFVASWRASWRSQQSAASREPAEPAAEILKAAPPDPRE